MRILSLAFLLFLSFSWLSCGESGSKSFSKLKAKVIGDDDDDDDDDDDTEEDLILGDPSERKGARKIRNNGGGFLLKTSKQIDEAIKFCFGADRMTVREAILISDTVSNAADAETGIAFLAGFKSGDKIVEVSASMFDGAETDQRTGVSNGQVTINYLTALQNTANVVAYNCSVAHRNQGSSPELCECETEEKALAMLNRCLPGEVPDALKVPAAAIAKVCKDDQRAAISSLISSFAFSGAQ